MEIRISEKAAKELDRIPEPVFGKIKEKIQKLGQNPQPAGAKRLAAWPGFRIRVGDYRLLYEIDQKHNRIIVYRIRHRKDVYR
jgi:mRNA interferase RelE/StbE